MLINILSYPELVYSTQPLIYSLTHTIKNFVVIKVSFKGKK